MPELHKQTQVQSSPQAWSVELAKIAGPETAARLGVPVGSVVETRETTAVATTTDSSKEG